MQCNLLPTQLDHVKLLICEQDDKNYPKLTPDAQNRFEIEKQNPNEEIKQEETANYDKTHKEKHVFFIVFFRRT